MKRKMLTSTLLLLALLVSLVSGCSTKEETIASEPSKEENTTPIVDEIQDAQNVTENDISEVIEETEEGRGDYISNLPFISFVKVYRDLFDGNQNKVVETDYYDIRVDSVVQDYVALSEALHKYSTGCADRIDDMNIQIMQVYEDISDIFDGVVEPSEESAIFFAGIEPKIIRLDENIFSMEECVYINSGGVHPSYGYNGYTFDVKSGKMLTLDDIFTDKEAFLEYMYQRFDELIKETNAYTSKTLNKNYKDILNSYDGSQMNWFLNSVGIVFVVNPDTIAPYAEGEILLPITYEEMTPFIKNSEYLPSANDSISNLINGKSGCVSLAQGLYVTNILTKEEEKTDVSIAIGENEVKIGENLTITDSYIVNRNNKSYMLMNLMDDSQEISFKCYEITDGSIKEVYASAENHFDATSLTIASFEICENNKNEAQILYFDVDIQ